MNLNEPSRSFYLKIKDKKINRKNNKKNCYLFIMDFKYFNKFSIKKMKK